jgi:hypothetical protein
MNEGYFNNPYFVPQSLDEELHPPTSSTNTDWPTQTGPRTHPSQAMPSVVGQEGYIMPSSTPDVLNGYAPFQDWSDTQPSIPNVQDEWNAVTYPRYYDYYSVERSQVSEDLSNPVNSQDTAAHDDTKSTTLSDPGTTPVLAHPSDPNQGYPADQSIRTTTSISSAAPLPPYFSQNHQYWQDSLKTLLESYNKSYPQIKNDIKALYHINPDKLNKAGFTTVSGVLEVWMEIPAACGHEKEYAAAVTFLSECAKQGTETYKAFEGITRWSSSMSCKRKRL